MALTDCVTYQGIEPGTCIFTPTSGSAVTFNLVTSISINPSLVLSQVKGDADIYPRCNYVSAGSSGGSVATTDIEKADGVSGVAGILVWDSKDKVSGTTVSYTVQDLTFSDSSLTFATESPTSEGLNFTCGSTGNDGITNPVARTFTPAP